MRERERGGDRKTERARESEREREEGDRKRERARERERERDICSCDFREINNFSQGTWLILDEFCPFDIVCQSGWTGHTSK